MHRYGSQDLRHDCITARSAHKNRLQLLERYGHGLKRGAVAQPARLAFEQADVMSPVVEGLAAIKAARVRGHPHAIGHGTNMVMVDPQADDTVGVLSAT